MTCFKMLFEIQMPHLSLKWHFSKCYLRFIYLFWDSNDIFQNVIWDSDTSFESQIRLLPSLSCSGSSVSLDIDTCWCIIYVTHVIDGCVNTNQNSVPATSAGGLALLLFGPVVTDDFAALGPKFLCKDTYLHGNNAVSKRVLYNQNTFRDSDLFYQVQEQSKHCQGEAWSYVHMRM